MQFPENVTECFDASADGALTVLTCRECGEEFELDPAADLDATAAFELGRHSAECFADEDEEGLAGDDGEEVEEVIEEEEDQPGE